VLIGPAPQLELLETELELDPDDPDDIEFPEDPPYCWGCGSESHYLSDHLCGDIIDGDTEN